MSSRVVLLPTLHDEAMADFAANLSFALSPQEVQMIASIARGLPENEWLAAVALDIAKADKAFQSVHLVAMGDAVLRLPDIAFAQRAARRRVSSYICVNQIPQGQFADWPDAPVVFIATDSLIEQRNLARLRGWETIDSTHEMLFETVANAVKEFSL